MKYLQLIRFQNLLLLAFMQWVMRYLFLTQSYIDLALTDINYLLLVVSTVCIAAGGAVMQHIVNQEEDEMIQPQKRVVGNTISEAAAYNWYIGLTIIGVGVGFYTQRCFAYSDQLFQRKGVKRRFALADQVGFGAIHQNFGGAASGVVVA